MKEDSNQQKSDDETVEKKDSNASSARKFLKKLDLSQGFEPEIKESEKSKDSKPEKKEKSENKESKQESHASPGVDKILKFFKVKDTESGKNKLKIIVGVIAGFILILVGILYIMVPVETVADNVIFGERAVFSVFLILVGILIIAVVLAQKYLNKSFFERIDTELEADKEVSSNQDEKNISNDSINRNNR